MCGPVTAEQKTPGIKFFQTIRSPLIYRPRKQCRSDAYIEMVIRRISGRGPDAGIRSAAAVRDLRDRLVPKEIPALLAQGVPWEPRE